MYFGGINGFNSFYPAGIRANPFIPPVYITGFQLFNQKVRVGGRGSPLKEDISLSKEIILSYKQSTFSFTFSALNFTSPENNSYAYMLEGESEAFSNKELEDAYLFFINTLNLPVTLVGGSLLQVLVIVAGIILPVMYILGGIFALLWVTGIWLGHRVENSQ